MDWNYNMDEAPLNTPIQLLSSDDCMLLPQAVYVGTIIDIDGRRFRGECIKGDPEYFNRSAIVAWKLLNKIHFLNAQIHTRFDSAEPHIDGKTLDVYCEW